MGGRRRRSDSRRARVASRQASVEMVLHFMPFHLAEASSLVLAMAAAEGETKPLKDSS